MRFIEASAPMRVSFAGGGSDYRDFSSQHVGVVVSIGLGWRVNVMVHTLGRTALEKFRCSYSAVESCDEIAEIQHPAIRETLTFMDWNSPIGIYTWSDVPARMGLGGSSAFTVALLAALHGFRGYRADPRELARWAVEIERDRAGEPGGQQDQYAAALGGLREYRFGPQDDVHDLSLPRRHLKTLSRQLVLIQAASQRDSGPAQAQIPTEHVRPDGSLDDRRTQKVLAERLGSDLRHLFRTPQGAADAIAATMRASQGCKVSLYAPPPDARKILQLSQDLGSRGEKLCGAGGSGFVAAIVPVSEQGRFLREIDAAGFAAELPGVSKAGVRVKSHDASWASNFRVMRGARSDTPPTSTSSV